MMSKKYVTLGLLAGLTAGGGAGLILSQTGAAGASDTAAAAVQQDDDSDDTTVDTTDDTTLDTSSDTSTDTSSDTTDEFAAEPGSHIQEVLAPLVAAGTITQAQADAVVDALVAARPQGGPGHHGHHGHHGLRGAKLETVAEALGITVEELRTELQAGQSIADVAGDQTQAVIDALVAEATARIEQGVADGRLTREEADAKLAEVTEKITELVNTVPPVRGADAPADDADGA